VPLAPQGIYGIHSWSEGASGLLGGRRGWTTETITAAESVDRSRFRAMVDEGYTPILRINHGYSGTGTIPLDGDYAGFCASAAAMALELDGLVDHFIIGNEMNAIWEGDGVTGIAVSDYADCFAQCADAIHAVRPDAQVLVGAVGCWNNQTAATGPYVYDFDNYWYELIQRTRTSADGVSVHTYGGRDGDPDPRDDGYWGFEYLQTQIEIIDAAGGGDLPIYVTEFNTAADGWYVEDGEAQMEDGYPDGWMQKAFEYVDTLNGTLGGCRIRAACWFVHDLVGWGGFSLVNLPTAWDDFVESTTDTDYRACE
jgi:hypothetical protein